MAKNGVCYKDLYLALEDLRREMNGRFDRMEDVFITFHKDEFEPLLNWKSELSGKLAVAGTLVLFVSSAIWTFVYDRIWGR
ncbi:MAG: hypothetical protein M1484_04490 [Patescibacteria group bacterium]|nr:hypothetical protein [Patescibacteria group bacterium]MCL5432317.1 hypothetical protein [Patescibacteria group bacterium]